MASLLIQELEKVGLDFKNYVIEEGNSEIVIAPYEDEGMDDYLKILTLYQRGWIFEYLNVIKGGVEALPTEDLIKNSVWILHKSESDAQSVKIG